MGCLTRRVLIGGVKGAVSLDSESCICMEGFGRWALLLGAAACWAVLGLLAVGCSGVVHTAQVRRYCVHPFLRAHRVCMEWK